MSATPHFLQPLLRAGSRCRLFVEPDGRLLATSVELALDSAARRRGLLGRPGLDADTAFIVAPSSAVHTFFMRFAIDLVFASHDGRVLKIRSGMGPWRVSGAIGAFAVIELSAGAAARAEVRVGDRVVIR